MAFGPEGILSQSGFQPVAGDQGIRRHSPPRALPAHRSGAVSRKPYVAAMAASAAACAWAALDAVRLEDATSAMKIAFTHANSATASKYLPETMGGGVALFDYDNDGRLD